MAVQVLDEEDVRRVVREELRLPAFVHQRNVERTLGLPGRDYLVAARASAFPSVKERRLVIARTDDVLRWIDRRLAPRGAKPAIDADAETVSLARVGARRLAR